MSCNICGSPTTSNDPNEHLIGFTCGIGLITAKLRPDTTSKDDELRKKIGLCLNILPGEFDLYLPNAIGTSHIDALEKLFKQYGTLERIDELRELQVAPGVSDEVKDAVYEGHTEKRLIVIKKEIQQYFTGEQ